MYVSDDGGGGWRGSPGGNGIGIFLESTFGDNNLSNNIAVNNMGGNGGSTLYATGPGGDGIGIYSRASNNNTFIGNIAQYNVGGTGGTPGNGVGIYFSSSDNNTYSGSIVQYNNNYGIYLSSSNNNTIYNNRFNNSNNFIASSSTNIWNITKTSGANVVGGPYFGGNFWESPDGTGYSRECTDADGDGICNFPYIIGTDTDYLPLSMNFPSESTPLIITTVYNNYFNDTNNFGTSVSTRWNITKTLGTNIVGGPYLGGNFWAKSDGTGYSQTCTDADWDGICDLPYTVGTDTDYLPLSMNYTNAPTGNPIGTPVINASNSPIIPAGYGKYQSEALDMGKNVSFITVNPIGTGKIDQAQVYTTYSIDGTLWSNWTRTTRDADVLYTVAPGQYGRYFGYIIIAPAGVIVTQTIIDYVVSPNGVIYII
jgi:parallel beta-helix repeat protein